MKKQRRNIQTVIRIGGIEFLFGLVFLLLPLSFELNEKVKNIMIVSQPILLSIKTIYNQSHLTNMKIF